MSDQLSACIDACPSAAVIQHRAHLARLERIASRAFQQHQPIAEPPETVVLPDPVEACLLQLEEAANAAIRRSRAIRVEAIQAEVASAFNITRREIMGSDRRASYVHARHIAMYLVNQLTGHSLQEIGRRFGGLDHTSVLYAIRKIARLVADDQYLAADVDAIRASIAAKVAA
jgi:hypothetical protein